MAKKKKKAASRRRKKAPRRAIEVRPTHLFEVLRDHVGAHVAATGKGGTRYLGVLRQVLHDGVLVELEDGLLYMGHADLELAIGAHVSPPAQGEPATRGVAPEEDVF